MGVKYPERFRTLVAHELGHNLGAEHVDPVDDPYYLMVQGDQVNQDVIGRMFQGNDAMYDYEYSSENKRKMVAYLGTSDAQCVKTLDYDACTLSTLKPIAMEIL